MPDYFEAPDGAGEPTIWVKGGPYDMPLIRQRDAGPDYWPDVVARMTGTTITNDDATLEVILDALDRHQYEQITFVSDEMARQTGVTNNRRPFDQLSERTRRLRRNQVIDAARAVLAALTGVPHD